MPIWKRNIFINAITARMHMENKTRDEIIATYNKLTDEEVEELRKHIPETVEQ